MDSEAHLTNEQELRDTEMNNTKSRFCLQDFFTTAASSAPLFERKLQTDEDLNFWEKQIDVDKKKRLADLEILKQVQSTEIELEQKKKNADEWGQLALREKQNALRKEEIELRKKELENEEKANQFQKHTTASATTSAAPTPARSNAPPAAKRKRKASSGASDTCTASSGGGTQRLIRDLFVAVLNRNSDE
jgi:hypothetical protein